MQKLSENKIEPLIELVRKYPALYEKRHDLYRKNEWREKTWNDIAKELESDVKDCKNAWRSLRDQFRANIKDVKRSTGDSVLECSTRKKYKYFENLLFLQESIKPRKTCNFQTIKREESYEIDTADEDSTFFWIQSDVEDLIVCPERATSSGPSGQFVFNAHRPERSSSLSRTSTPTQPKKIKVERNTDQVFGHFFKDLLQQVSAKSNNNEIDGVDHFFLGLSHTVKSHNLTPLELTNLQCKITVLISEEVNKLKSHNPKS